ncbi:MAG TPA: hypothetical protein PLU72_12610 [Candidatus Ozemobacteraceae bacterium]|nr:hypothetical protein [Candidatus Ozemobacteraceae bacterium]
MNRRHLLAMAAGLIETPPFLVATLEPLRAVVRGDQVNHPPAGWEARHSTGKRCGHLHRNHEKACACADRLGKGWAVVPVG